LRGAKKTSSGYLEGYNFWREWGSACPKLSKLAIRVLSQVASASACERNWSTYDFIHSKKRNKLLPKRAEDLVFVFTNLRLLRNIKNVEYEEKEIKCTGQGIAENTGDEGEGFMVLGEEEEGEAGEEAEAQSIGWEHGKSGQLLRSTSLPFNDEVYENDEDDEVDGGDNGGGGQENVSVDVWENMTQDYSEEEIEGQSKMYRRICSRKRRNVLSNSNSSFDE
jgi:hAT family C-terminal dimerisation region